ncbi:alcohol dehydrogenase [Fusarium flagelliforme]|uniref:Alcohol dehydrogenase n=1 Tax=Fusarium flagelliforme TaxID=2675880 RepID=A0A395N310_9HYPO|nr:alcohol dehydrogenase [Fusarium flagelliforme]
MEQLETTQPLTLAPCEERIEAIADEAATREADAGWAIRIAVSSSARNDVVGVGGTIQISGLGFDHTLEIDGAASIAQSLKSVKLGGVITIIGFLTSSDKQTALMEALNHLCIVRGIFAGSKVQFGEMNRAIDSIKMKPVVDRKIFSFEEVKEAYRYQWDRKKFGKVVIQVGN